MDEVRLCGYPGCGRPLVMRLDETPARFARRLYCDRTCCTRQKTLKIRQKREKARKTHRKRGERVQRKAPVEVAPVAKTVSRVIPGLLMARRLRGSVYQESGVWLGHDEGELVADI